MGRYDNATPGAIRAGKRIRAAREAAGLTRTQLAKSAKCGLSTLARIENGYQATPRMDAVGRILKALRATSGPRANLRREALALRDLAGLGER